MKHFLTSVFAIAMLFCPTLIWADVDFMAPQIQDSTCAVVGKVYSELTQRPIENAKITVVDEDGKKFQTASGDLGLFKIQGLVPGHDLLNNSQSYSINYTSDSRVQTWRPILGRYYMLGLSWRFRKNL